MKLEKTHKLVKEKFKDIVDKNGQPYIYHLEGVFMIASTEYRVDEEHQHIALLHDIIEDTPTTLDDLSNLGYSETIVKGVDILSKRPVENYDAYTDRVCADAWMMLLWVKLADLEHNMALHRLPGQNFSLMLKYRDAYNQILFKHHVFITRQSSFGIERDE